VLRVGSSCVVGRPVPLKSTADLERERGHNQPESQRHGYRQPEVHELPSTYAGAYQNGVPIENVWQIMAGGSMPACI
jgi:hypothetical protein